MLFRPYVLIVQVELRTFNEHNAMMRAALPHSNSAAQCNCANFEIVIEWRTCQVGFGRTNVYQ